MSLAKTVSLHALRKQQLELFVISIVVFSAHVLSVAATEECMIVSVFEPNRNNINASELMNSHKIYACDLYK